MNETLCGLLDACFDGDLEALLVLSDYLEDSGDARAPLVRTLYERLWGEWVFAPRAFAYHEVARQTLVPRFTEYRGRRIRLRCVSGNDRGHVWEFDTGLSIGRGADDDVILNDTSVSQQDAVIRSRDGGWWVRGRSRNGTFVNDVELRAEEWRRLAVDDIIRMGGSALAVEAVAERGSGDDEATSSEPPSR